MSEKQKSLAEQFATEITLAALHALKTGGDNFAIYQAVLAVIQDNAKATGVSLYGRST